MRLVDDVERLIAGLPGVFGVYARNLSTDETVAVDADGVMPAESAAKTFNSCEEVSGKKAPG